MAVCTKDQAYGLYLAMPFVIIHRLAVKNRDAGHPRPWIAAVVDRRLLSAGVVAAILFALLHNLAFNAGGFVEHVRYLVGGGSQGYRVFEPTRAGRLALAHLTVRLMQLSWGWPITIVAAAGMIAAFADRRTRATFWALALPLASYYFLFVNTILYNYDRFMIPVGFVLALFGGMAFSRVWESARGGGRAWKIAAIGACFAYTILYTATVDVLMLRDSRYTVQRWMAAHVPRASVVASCFDLQYLPDFSRFRHVDVCTSAAFHRESPDYFVLNADYARAVTPDSDAGQFMASLKDGRLGYDLVFHFRQPAPWPWLPGGHRDLVGDRLESVVFSTLRNINPTIEIYSRRR
jgi:hypothetical protein